MAFILALFAISLASGFLIPVTLAFLLFFVFARLRRSMVRRKIPAGIAAGLIVLTVVVAVALVLMAIATPASQLLDRIPEITGRLESKIQGLRGSISLLDAAVMQLRRNGDPESAVVTSSAFIAIVTAMPELVGQVFFVLCLLFFLILCGDLLYLKIVQSFDALSDKRAAYKALRDIEDSLGQYLGAITIINVGLGVAIGLAMWALGMPSPAVFGLMAFLFNFVPYLGAIAGALVATFVALMTFFGIGYPLFVGLVYMALTAIEGQLITPYYVSRRLRMNPVVVFGAIALGAYLWSIVGMVVAVPLLVVTSVIADHLPALHKFANFLSGESPPLLATTDTPT
ncbi:AI-2E family transporter [Pseudorhodobacter sp.]|uniref:AI-2E family transporter n=1 Tax=Pseudorhodobacter sp. TaxID=1934400 RepID=UPI002AFE7FB3|nr:AI-2E family transporter [Pseudorhodobacter sp.]